MRPMRPVQRTPFDEEILPLRATGPHEAHHPAKHPCRGFGLNTPAHIRAYTQGFEKLQKEWGKLTPDQRRERVSALANTQLQAGGVPRVKINDYVPPDPNRNGEMDFTTWTLDINRRILNAPVLSPADGKSLADTVYHESRHAEQWYLIARDKAGHLQAQGGQTPAQQSQAISQAMDIPPGVSNSAQKNPLPKNSPQAPCARLLNDSIYGKNAAHRERTLTNLGKLDQELTAAAAQSAHAQNVYNHAAAANKARDLQNWQNAFNHYQAALKRQQQNYQAYRDLPEEADAWETGTQVEKDWKP